MVSSVGNAMNGPLDDLRVLDLSHYYAGPYATMLLSFLGAEVVKIESPDGGEHGRTFYRRPGAPIGLPFALMNSNKRSVTLNLKKPEGLEIFKRLVSRFDLLVENFAPGVMARLGCDYQTLSSINPRLIYASVTGYGRTGAYAKLPAFDPVVQAMGGIVGTTGEASGSPMRAGPTIADILGGAHFTAAILAAIRERDRTGKGLQAEIALYDAVIPTLTTHVGAYYGLGCTQLRTGNRSPGAAIAPSSVYPARDGYVLILGDSDERWRRLCDFMGRPELCRDERFATSKARVEHQDELDQIIALWTRTFPKRELMDRLNAGGVLCGMVQELPEVLTDPDLHQRGMLQEIDHPSLGRITVITSPLRLHDKAPEVRKPAPVLGADNEWFYENELQISREGLAGLRSRGVV